MKEVEQALNYINKKSLTACKTMFYQQALQKKQTS